MMSSKQTLSPALRRTCAFTALFSLLAHGYRYLTLGFSGDAMLLTQEGEAAYQITLGRFLQPVYWAVRGLISAPLVIGLFATAFLAVAACLVVHLLELERPVHIALVCGVLTANETLAASNATYLPWTDVYMLALALCMLGVYAFFRMRHGLAAGAVLLCLSLGLYQSYLPAAAMLSILVLFKRTLDGTPARAVWRQGLGACVMLLLSLLLYALALRSVLAVTGATASQDYNGVGRVAGLSLRALPGLLLDTCTAPLRFFFSLSDTPVMTWHVSAVPAALNIVIFLLAAPRLLTAVRRLPAASLLTLLFLLLVMPPAMNFIQLIAQGIASGLTIYAYQFAYLLPVVLMARPAPQRLPARLPMCLCACALAGMIGLNIVHSNQMYLKRDLEYASTASVMTRLLDHAARTEGYVPGETPVVLIGMLPSSPVSMERPGFETVARIQGMRYTYAASYETAAYWYLQMALGEPINLVSHEERRARYGDEGASGLSAFPDAGCCRMQDGILYLRIN